MASCDRDPSLSTSQAAGRQTPTPPFTVVIIFKERCYETGLPKSWLFTSIDYVTIVQGRIHLYRHDYGLVCDLPRQDVAQVYTRDGDTGARYSQETWRAMNDTKSAHISVA